MGLEKGFDKTGAGGGGGACHSPAPSPAHSPFQCIHQKGACRYCGLMLNL